MSTARSIASSLRHAWARINEPRVISVAYFCMYTSGVAAGVYATISPPTSIEGQIGSNAMAALTVLLTFGCALGSVAALPGIYWLERSAVLSIALAAFIYLAILATLQVQQPGNRVLQMWFVSFVLGMQLVRWARVSERPYRPVDARPADV
ncbi:hypothetical protein NSA53_19895 [Cellulosimicrobium cellulans]|uniref:hypothetical protein n=1 Tax=Cellulosimicrobium cellulans TaxID=1710 RepID=UPI002149E878|nr:hypothetical protein [Cellulosimicrobium cellulans]